MSRQIGEAMKINFSKDSLLNSKLEYVKNCLTSLIIEESSWDRSERERMEEQEETTEKATIERFKRKVEKQHKVDEIVEHILSNASRRMVLGSNDQEGHANKVSL